MMSRWLPLAMGLSVAGAACLRPPEGPLATTSAARVFHFSEQEPDQAAGHATFFSRVHQRVTDHWYADQIYRKYDPVGPLFGACDHHATELIIEVLGSGALQSVELLKSCGLDFLDEETIAAVRSAAPFERPPRELVDTHGFVRFGFNVVFESQPAPAEAGPATPDAGTDPAPPPPR
jgi:TonB family protein